MARTVRRIPENIESKIKYNRVINKQSLSDLHEDFSRGKLNTYIDTDHGSQEDSPEGKRFWKKFYRQRERRQNKQILNRELLESEFYDFNLEDLKISIYNLLDSSGNLESINSTIIEKSCDYLDFLYLYCKLNEVAWVTPNISYDYGLKMEFSNAHKNLAITFDFSSITYFKSWGEDLHNQSDYGDCNLDFSIYYWLVS